MLAHRQHNAQVVQLLSQIVTFPRRLLSAAAAALLVSAVAAARLDKPTAAAAVQKLDAQLDLCVCV